MDAKKNGGFSLVEILAAITVLGLAAVPMLSGMILSHRLNARADSTMSAQIRLASSLEILRGEQIRLELVDDAVQEGGYCRYDRVPLDGISVRVRSVEDGCYEVVATDTEHGDLSMTTCIGVAP